jgi:AcrR family transcriptional regulator
MTDKRTYHHGDLRRAVLVAAAQMIDEGGPSQLNLREVARRAGVSHAAPAYHFGDKPGLLTALATQGYEMLADALATGTRSGEGELEEMGVGYVGFAAEHPAHFEVMFRPDLYRADDPDLVAARTRARERLHAGVGTVPARRRGDDTPTAGLAAWLLAHGFATLRRSGSLAPVVGDQDPEDVFRATAALLFAEPGPSRRHR